MGIKEKVTKKSTADYTVMSKDSSCITGGGFLRFSSKGEVCAAFALGMVVAALFPYKLAIIIIAAVLIIAGLSLCRFW